MRGLFIYGCLLDAGRIGGISIIEDRGLRIDVAMKVSKILP